MGMYVSNNSIQGSVSLKRNTGWLLCIDSSLYVFLHPLFDHINFLLYLHAVPGNHQIL